jgi:hypothetical protein
MSAVLLNRSTRIPAEVGCYALIDKGKQEANSASAPWKIFTRRGLEGL